MASSSQIIEKLNLKPHPEEGGFYSETFRDHSVILSKTHLPSHYKVDRPVSTSIYFMLPSGSVSHLHRIPCAETWHFYLGEPITVLELNEETMQIKLTCIGTDLLSENQAPQYTVPPNVWFGAFPTKDYSIDSNGSVQKKEPRNAEDHYSLVGCTCAPAFQFEDFELAKRSDLVSRFPKKFRDTWAFLNDRVRDAFDLKKTMQEAKYLAEAVNAGMGGSLEGFMKRAFQ